MCDAISWTILLPRCSIALYRSFLGKQVFKVLKLSFENLVFCSQCSVVQFESRVFLCLLVELELNLIWLRLFLLATLNSRISVFQLSDSCTVEICLISQVLVVFEVLPQNVIDKAAWVRSYELCSFIVKLSLSPVYWWRIGRATCTQWHCFPLTETFHLAGLCI